MLLRSSSTPILDSRIIPHGKDSPPETDLVWPLPRTKSLSLTASLHSPPHGAPAAAITAGPGSLQKMARALSETDLRDPLKRNPHEKRISPASFDDGGEEWDPARCLLSSSGLGEPELCGAEDCFPATPEVGGGGAGKGSSGGDGHGRGGGKSESNQWHDSTDVYYKKMIEANPGNALLLGNYAKFLKEVKVKTTYLLFLTFLFGSP